MISNTSKFAIRALIYLELYSSAQKKVGIKQMIADLDIPAPFLSKIMQMLVKSELIHSVKGPGGGFYLAKPAIDITLYDVIVIVEGKNVFGNCVIKSVSCDATEPCSVHDKLTELRSREKSLFSADTIADLVSEFREGNERIRI